MAASLNNQIFTSTNNNESMNNPNEYKGLLVIIPTRNRPDLAINAILSVLNQPNCEDVNVLVSDNSTETESIEVLSSFCQQTKDNRLSYIKTPEPMPMAKHWDWVINQALELYDLNHFLYLTDRSVFKNKDLKMIKHIASIYPEEIISYHYDTIFDHKNPIEVYENIWTGKLFKVKSSHLLSLSSQSVMHQSLPKLLNSLIPRFVFESIRSSFGNICISIAPDYCFCYRCLEMYDSILYYDKALIFMYGIDKSNGSAFIRGLSSKTTNDFIANFNQGVRYAYAAPIPEFRTAGNAKIHEYCFVKEETKSSKFPEIDRAKYLELLASEVTQFENEQLKLEMLEILKLHGWQERPIQKKSFITAATEKIIKGFNIKRLFHKMLTLASRSNNKIKFNTSQEAIEYFNTHYRRKISDKKYLESLIQSLGLVVDLPE